MEKINIEGILNKYKLERSEIDRREAIIYQINDKLHEIRQAQTEIPKFDKSSQNAKSISDKATFTMAKFEAEQRIETLGKEVETLAESLQLLEQVEKPTDVVVQKSDDDIIAEQGRHKTWLGKTVGLYALFAFASLLLFIIVHGSQYLFTQEWSELLNTIRYTHQIFLKIAIGFFGILCVGISINFVLPSVLWYYNKSVNKYDFLSDFLKAEPHTRLYVSSFLLYVLFQYWGSVMSWQIVL